MENGIGLTCSALASVARDTNMGAQPAPGRASHPRTRAGSAAANEIQVDHRLGSTWHEVSCRDELGQVAQGQ